ncbi:Hypothetical_protein [Hexamita inflata]|uniref:Hypothetical_protein n=1 Tax=Hexamita inflata TaxID=28002 RepID=A0AA86TZ91_9EUKA|nr:Hypothetical protein HINF_LOCUS21764 [Hexamita inflata]
MLHQDLQVSLSITHLINSPSYCEKDPTIPDLLVILKMKVILYHSQQGLKFSKQIDTQLQDKSKQVSFNKFCSGEILAISLFYSSNSCKSPVKVVLCQTIPESTSTKKIITTIMNMVKKKQQVRLLKYSIMLTIKYQSQLVIIETIGLRCALKQLE